MVDLMASNGLDSKNDKILIDTKIYDENSQTWVRVAKTPRKSALTVQEAREVFSKSLSVSQDKKSSFITIATEHYSPYVAK
jgi:hypothetical protein